MSAAESGIMYIVVAHCDHEVIRFCEARLRYHVDVTLSWAHTESPSLPDFVEPAFASEIKEYLPLWRLVNNYVKENGAFPPLKIFKHAT